MIKDGIQQVEQLPLSILMIGQSNMAGRGDIADVEQIKNPNCFMLRNGRWQPMSDPVNPDRSIFSGKFRSGVSLATSFADALSKHLARGVGLIPCADGGSAIEQWQSGEPLFDHAVMQTELAARSSELGGIIWHQGESNCLDADYPTYGSYKAKLLTLMTELREELGAEELPLVMGEISEQITERWFPVERVRAMNAVIHEVARSLPSCAVVNVQGLSLRPDGVHFNAAACRELGLRYFEAFVALRKG